MLNKNSLAGTAAQKSSKSSWLFRSALLLAIPMLCAVFSATGQIGWKDSATTSGTIGNIANLSSITSTSKLYINSDLTPSAIDTVRCLFLEITDTTNTDTKWTKGYVVRRNGYIKFGKNTEVGEAYLPITSGIVMSELMYDDRRRVSNKALQIVLVK